MGGCVYGMSANMQGSADGRLGMCKGEMAGIILDIPRMQCVERYLPSWGQNRLSI